MVLWVEMMRTVSCKWASIVIWLVTFPDDNPSFREHCGCCISIALYGVPPRNHLTEFYIISICSCYDLAQLGSCLYIANVIWHCHEQWDKRINRNNQIKLTITKGEDSRRVTSHLDLPWTKLCLRYRTFCNKTRKKLGETKVN